MTGDRGQWPDVPDLRWRIMRGNKRKNTKPEEQVRQLLHSMEYRHRLHRRDNLGCPDITLPARRKVVEVMGCFFGMIMAAAWVVNLRRLHYTKSGSCRRMSREMTQIGTY